MEWRNVKIPLAWSKDGQFYLSVFQNGSLLECVPVRRYNDGETQLLGEPKKFVNSEEFMDMLADANQGWFDKWEPEEYDDGQPSWEQEWEDFGEVYSDEPDYL